MAKGDKNYFTNLVTLFSTPITLTTEYQDLGIIDAREYRNIVLGFDYSPNGSSGIDFRAIASPILNGTYRSLPIRETTATLETHEPYVARLSTDATGMWVEIASSQTFFVKLQGKVTSVGAIPATLDFCEYMLR